MYTVKLTWIIAFTILLASQWLGHLFVANMLSQADKKPLVEPSDKTTQSSHHNNAEIKANIRTYLKENNINKEEKPWKQALLSSSKFRSNVRQYQTDDFENLSKKLVLSNLNKVVFTNANHQIVDGFSNIINVTHYLDN